MTMTTHPRPMTSWRQLQTELRDLAYLLDRQGSHATAELVVGLAAGLEDLLAAPSIVDERRQDHVP